MVVNLARLNFVESRVITKQQYDMILRIDTNRSSIEMMLVFPQPRECGQFTGLEYDKGKLYLMDQQWQQTGLSQSGVYQSLCFIPYV